MKIYVDANYDSSTPIPAGYDAAVTSIKAAITEAKKTTDYVTIEIAAGDYTEGIINFGTRTFEENGTTYTGGITFKAVDGAVVNINGCFQCNSPANDIKDVVFEGLNITNSVINGGYFAPIMFGDNYAVKTASGLAVKNCTLNSTAVGGTASGVALAMTLKCDGINITENIINADCGVYGGDGNLIANTNISGNTMNGNETVPNYNYWGMVYIYNSGEGNVISGNEITGSALDYAVRVRNGEGVILTDNIITDCGEVEFTNGSVVSGNTVDGEALVFPAYKGKELLVSTGLAGKDGETVIIDEMAYTVGTNVFADLNSAVAAADKGATIIVSGDVSGKAVFDDGKNLTITGTADFAWGDGNSFFFVGRGSDDAVDTTVTFKDAVIGSSTNSTAYGFNIAQNEGAGSGKADGTVNIDNSSIVTDYMQNRNIVNVKGDGIADGFYGKDGEANLYVKNYFAVSRDNDDTKSAELNLTEGAYVKIDKQNGAGIGYGGGRGVLNITDSKFEAMNDLTVANSNAAVNVTDGILKVGGTLTNNGTITVSEKAEATFDISKLTGKAVIIKNGAALVNSTVAGPHLEPSGKANDPEASDAYTSYVLSVNGNEAGTAYFKGTNKIASLDAAAGDTVIVSGQGNSLEFTGDGFKLGNGAKWEITDGAAVSGWALSLDNVADGQSFNSEMLVQNAAMTVDKISAKGTTAGQEIGAGKFDVTFDKADVTLKGSTAIETQAQDTAKINLTFKNGTTIKGANGADSIKSLKNDSTESAITFDNTDVNVTGTFRNKGTVNIQNGADVVVTKITTTDKSYEHYSANEGTINIIGGSLTHENLLNSGTVTVTGGTLDADKVTNSGTFEVSGESTLLIDDYNNGVFVWGKAIQLLDGAIIKDSNVGGYVDAVGKVTFRGDNTFVTIQDFEASYIDNNEAVNNTEMIIEKGASVTTTSQKFNIGFGDKLSVYGNLEDAKAAYEAGTLTEDDYSLDAQAGMFFQGNRADDVTTFNVNDAYVRLGKKEKSVANAEAEKQRLGTYNFNWTNAVVESEEIFNFKDSGENNGNYNFNLTRSVFTVGGPIHYDDKDSTFKAVDSKVVSLFEYNSDAAISNGTVYNHSNGGTLDFQNSTLEFGSTFINNGDAAFSGEAAALNAPVVVNNGKLSVTNGASVTADTFASALATFNFQNGSSSKALEEITIVRFDSEGKEAGRQTAWLNPSNVAALLTCPDGGSYKFYKGDTEITVSDLEITKADSSEIIIDESGKITATAGFDNNGTITINTSDNWSGIATVIDANKGANFGEIKVDEADAAAGITYHIDEANGDLVVFNKSLANTVYVNANWADSDYAFGQEFESGKYFGINALTELTPATFSGMTDDLVINVYSDIDAEWINTTKNGKKVFGQAITFQKAAGVDGDVTVTLPTITTSIDGENYAGYFTKDLTIGGGVKLDTNSNSMDYGNALRFAPAGDKLTLTVDGTFIYSTGDFGVAKLGEDGLPVMTGGYQTDEATGKIALEEGKSVEVVVNAGGKMLACGESNVTFLANSKLSVTGTGTAEDKMDEVQFSAGSFASFAGEVNFKNTNVEIAGMSSYILGPDANVPDETFTGDKVLTAENTVINIVDYTGNPNVVAFNKTSNLTNTDISAGNLFVKGKTITMNGGSLTLTSGEADASLGPTDDYKSTGKLGISENAELIAKGSALIDVESVANSGKLTIDGALFNGGTVENDGIISIKGDSTVNATVTGNALQVASGAKLSGELEADMALAGNITVSGIYTGAVTGNKNITLESGSLNIRKGSKINSVTFGGGASNALTVQDTIENVTIKGDFNALLINAGGEIKNITIDGTVNYKPKSVGFVIDSFGNAAVKGKNNATLTVNAGLFHGNKVSKVELNLTGVNFANGVNISIDSLANIKSINGNAVVNVGGLYTLVSGEQTYILAQDENKVAFSTSSNPDEVAIDSLKKLDVKEDNTSLANINVEMAKGTTTVKVANGKTVKGGGIDLLEFAIGGISKSENGGKNNLTFGNFTDVEINGAVDALGSLTIGKDSIVKVEGTVSGNNTAQKVSIGAGTNATFADFNFDNNRNAADKDSFSVAAGAIVTTGNINGLDKLTIASGKTNAQSEMTINGNFAASHANNSITLGNYAELTITGMIDNGTDTATGTTIKAGNFSSIEVYGNVNGLAGLTLGKESTFDAGSINGTEKANKINIGAGAEVEVGAIDLKDGKNSIVLGKDAYLEAASISNAMTINIGSNEAYLNVFGAIDGVQKLTVGKGGWLDAASISGTDGNDTFNFANESWSGESYAKIALDFGEGKNTLSIGSKAQGYFADTTFGTGNDTVKIGNDSIVEFGELDMGDGKDTVTLGKNSKLTVSSLAGIETINATKGAELWFNNGADVDIDGILDAVAGSWNKNATLMDDCGTLAAGANAGSVYYSNEWDVYSVDTTSGGTLTLEGTGVEFQYSIDGGNWLVGNEITFKAGADVDIRVTVAEEFNKEKKDYSFSATLA